MKKRSVLGIIACRKCESRPSPTPFLAYGNTTAPPVWGHLMNTGEAAFAALHYLRSAEHYGQTNFFSDNFIFSLFNK